MCENYLADFDEADLTVKLTDADIEREQDSPLNINKQYAEALAICRKIVAFGEEKGTFLLHAAVFEVEGRGIALIADSGTGKSTHMLLWKKLLGDKLTIINGDKPIVRIFDSVPYAYGTPWCGKEGWQSNTRVPLKAICFLERAEQNSIERIAPDEAVMRIFHQILTPQDMETVDALFPLLDRTLCEIPCFVLGCNISEDAAQVAYDGMK